MDAMFDTRPPVAGRRVNALTVLMLLAAGAMAWVFVEVGMQAGNGQARVADVSEQMLLSQRLATHARAARAGDSGAVATMMQERQRFSTIIDKQSSGFGALTGNSDAPESRLLSGLENQWRVIRGHAYTVLQGEALLMETARVSGLLNASLPQFLDNTQDVTRLLVKKGAGARRVQLAGRQEMLVQRIVNSLDVIMTGDDVESAVESFVKDAGEFARVLDGFRRGTGGIEQLQGKTLQGKVREQATLFGPVSEYRGAIADNPEGLVTAQTAAAAISSDSEALYDAASNLKDTLESSPGSLLAGTRLVYIVGAVALLTLFWVAFEILRSQRRRSRLAEDENAGNQQAIMRLLDEMGDLAEGDLTVHATVSEDFTGSIADSINVTVDSLRGLVRTINDTSTQLSASVQETEAIAAQLSTASMQQSRDIAAAGSSINEMSGSMSEVSRNANESSRVAMQSVEIARKGGEAVQRTMDGMDTIREHIQETSKRIKRLGESSQEIGDIVELINDIAEQTNILALNASIQAAMAGEAGRGFAVVADEVQRLAERSANATRQIEALVKTIQADTNEAVISMEKSTTGVVNGAQLAEAAGGSLEEIESVSDRLAGLIQKISDAAHKQADAASELSVTMNGIQDMTLQATSGTERTSRSIGNLSRLAQDLDTSVAGFKLP